MCEENRAADEARRLLKRLMECAAKDTAVVRIGGENVIVVLPRKGNGRCRIKRGTS